MLGSHFAGGVSEHGEMQKGSLKGWWKESREIILT